jgi:hypothetical protein
MASRAQFGLIDANSTTQVLALAPCMTATGSARFTTPMGYDIKLGYGVGVTLELAKEVLPVDVHSPWVRRVHGSGVDV